MFVPFLSQGLCTNEAENTVVFLCKIPEPMSTDSGGPFANYQSLQESVHLHLNLVQHA